MERFDNLPIFYDLEYSDTRGCDFEYVNETEEDPQKLWKRIRFLEKQLENVKRSRLLYWEEYNRFSLVQCEDCGSYYSLENPVKDTENGTWCFDCFREFQENEKASGNMSDDSDEESDPCPNIDFESNVKSEFESYNSIDDFDVKKIQCYRYLN